jgi:hypothetical protein
MNSVVTKTLPVNALAAFHSVVADAVAVDARQAGKERGAAAFIRQGLTRVN